MGAAGETKTTNADFLRYCLKRVWMAEGASEEHAQSVADALMVGIRQGKLNQGLGVYEAIDLTNQYCQERKAFGGHLYDLGAIRQRMAMNQAKVDAVRASMYHAAWMGDDGQDNVKAMSGVKDFWQEPTYAELLSAMQKRVHDYVVADQGTAQEALDKLIVDWTETFEDDGKL